MSKFKKLLIVFNLLGVTLCAQESIDFIHMDLELSFDTATSKVMGDVELDFVTAGKVDSVFLNSVKITVEKVRLNGGKVKFGSNSKGFWILPKSSDIEDTNTIALSYECIPRKGIYFIGWNDPERLSKRQIWTQGQGIDHRHWIPHRDDQTDKITTDIKIHFNKKYQVVSNGDLIERSEKRKMATWHYRMDQPHSSYLIMIAIGEYDHKSTASASEIPLHQYYYPERHSDYDHYYRSNEEIFNFLEDEIGVPFPWKSYSQVPVQDFRHGAMENTTATIFGDFFLVDEVAFNDRNYTYVNAHELAHQWFGNLVTADGSDNHWLHEGFATYYQWLSEKNLYGQDFFDWERWKAAELIREASEVDRIPLGNGKAGSSRFYQKGAWVLYMLRETLGDEDYRLSIQSYLRKNAFGVVTTKELQHAIFETVEVDVSGFLAYWVEDPNELKVSVASEVKENKLKLKLTATDSLSPHFSIHIPVKLFYESGKTDIKFIEYWKEGGDTFEFDLQPSEEFSYWLFNPKMSVLIFQDETKPFVYLQKQLLLAENVLDRYQAIRSLVKMPINEVGELLVSTVSKTDEYYPIRFEALKYLLLNNYDKYSPLLKTVLLEGDIQLQKMAVQLVKQGANDFKDILAKLMLSESYELRESAIALSIDFQNPEKNKWVFDTTLISKPGIPGRYVELSLLFYQSAIFRDGEALSKLKKRVSESYDFNTRIRAIQLLSAYGYLDEELISYYFDALFNYNWKLRREARMALKKLHKTSDMIDNFVVRNWDSFSSGQQKQLEVIFEKSFD